MKTYQEIKEAVAAVLTGKLSPEDLAAFLSSFVKLQEHAPIAECSAEINEIAGALAEAQKQIKGAVKDALNPHFRSNYADLASVWDACHEPLNANGIAVSQLVQRVNGEVVLVTRLVHKSGQWLRSEYPIVPVQNTPQGVGSAITYARRYSLAAMSGVAPREDDDDGNEASGRTPQNDPPRGGWKQLDERQPQQERQPAQAQQGRPQRQGPVTFKPIEEGCDSLPEDIAAVKRELNRFVGRKFSILEDADLAALERTIDAMTEKAQNENKVALATLAAIVRAEIGKRVKAGAA
jgi:hypothetical protein